MRTRMIGLFGVALVLLGTLAVSAQEVAPTKASSVCVLPFAAGEGVPADLGYRFWAGVMDQLAAQPELALNRDGALVRAALAQKKACSEMREGDIPGVAKAVGVDWVVTGTLVADTDGTVTAVGTAFRTADGGATSTPRYRIGAGEREKASREGAAYLVRFVSTAPAAPVPVRVASVDGAVATFAAALESLTRQRFAAGLGEVLAGGHADEARLQKLPGREKIGRVLIRAHPESALPAEEPAQHTLGAADVEGGPGRIGRQASVEKAQFVPLLNGFPGDPDLPGGVVHRRHYIFPAGNWQASPVRAVRLERC